MFKQFEGYNIPEKHKKRKKSLGNLKKEDIVTYSAQLFTMAACSYMKKTKWVGIKESILRLAENLRKYGNSLEKQSARTAESHKRLFVSDVDEWNILQPRLIGTPSEMAHYNELRKALHSINVYEVIFLNEFCPNDRKRKYDYLKNIFTPFNCTMYTYTGGKQHLHFIWKVDALHDTTERINRNEIIKKQLESKLPTYHSRGMRKEFLSKFGRITNTSTAFLREMYRTLVGDSSCSANLSTEAIDMRVRECFDTEDTELITDLRANNRRPGEKYAVFLAECQKYIDSIETAVDERRHDDVDNVGDIITHMATSLNARTLFESVCEKLPPDTPIPSLQWLRYQFWPRNACQSHTHTGKLKIKYMVQSRQLRLDHPDVHYASAVYKYQKEFACKFKNVTEFVSCDDKHTIKVGEPNYPVAAVDRGKVVLCRLVGDKKLFQVADHDFTKSSFTPSVHLLLDIPDSVEGSFYRGRVHVGIKENAFQPSSSWRHACELINLLEKIEYSVKPILLLYTDGGPDHNITFLRTQLSLIAMFFNLNLDFLCAVRTPPHHSWKNPVERIMSILNIALNAVGMMRNETVFDNQLKSASNLKDIRKLSDAITGFKDEYMNSMGDAKRLLEELFVKLKLKDHYFKVFQPAPEDAMGELLKNIPAVDEDVVRSDLKKNDLNKYPKLSEFLSTHCRCRHYMFSIKKCGEACIFGCKPPQLPKEVFDDVYHLPDPVPEAGGEHYKSFETSYSQETKEEYRPSLKDVRKRDHGMPFSPSSQYAKNTDTFLQCQQCGRWRCLYSKLKLKVPEKESLSKFIEEHDYVCGATFSNVEEDDDLNVVNVAFVNGSLTCNSVMEKSFYSSCADIVCFQCGTDDMVESGVSDVYPLCRRCQSSGVKFTSKVVRKVKPNAKK